MTIRPSLYHNEAANALRHKRLGVSVLGGFALLSLISSSLGQEESVITSSSLEERSKQIFEAKLAISKERAAWAEQKALFASLIELREKEIAEIDQFTEAAKQRVGEVTKQQAALKTEEAERKAWRKSMGRELVRLESSLQNLIPLLPPPARKEIETMIDRVSQGPSQDSAALQERFRDVLSILSAASDFNSKLTIDNEIRDFDGKRYQLDVFYLGLAQAWFVDESNQVAGVGLPTASGWVWERKDRLANRIRTAIDINQREVPPAMVSLPFAEKAAEGDTP